MKFSELSKFLQELEETSSRNRMIEILAELFKVSSKEEIDKICYLTLGQLAPLYAQVEFNLAEKMIVRALSLGYNVNPESVVKQYKKVGDLGDVAEELAKSKIAPPAKPSRRREASLWRSTVATHGKTQKSKLSVVDVYERLMDIATETGEGSQERKLGGMAKLLSELEPLSAKYVVRIPLGRLRLGFSDLTILDALSWMIAGDKSKRGEIEEAFNVRADIGQIAKLIKEKGLKALVGIKVSLGTPIMPALCQRLPTAEEMIKKMVLRQAQDKVAVEPKYDGTRLGVHFSRLHPRGVNVNIFTRNLENVAQMFPDITEALPKEVKAREAILDGEAIGFDPKTGKFLPFQETIKRKRKYEVKEKAKEIPLKYFAFDILFKDGKDLLAVPFDQRRQILEKTLSPANQTIVLSPQIVTDNAETLRRFHDEQVKNGLEGAVVKKWQAPYDPGRRGYTWVKFKEEETKKGGGLADTLDCVVMGYYKGRGKRAGFGIGAFLVGVRRGEEFLTISKIGTGLTDEQWREMRVRSEKWEVGSQPKQYLVDKNLVPDVWCQPAIVVEIQADNITKSPIHTAKYALRFPRLVRFREDKSPQEATTLAEAEKLYRLQK
ncbi:MAG: ATP-dependent DNA ligase [Patescibacteria group bacterium]